MRLTALAGAVTLHAVVYGAVMWLADRVESAPRPPKPLKVTLVAAPELRPLPPPPTDPPKAAAPSPPRQLASISRPPPTAPPPATTTEPAGPSAVVNLPGEQSNATLSVPSGPEPEPQPEPVVSDLKPTHRPPTPTACPDPPTKPAPLDRPTEIAYLDEARAAGVEGRLVLQITVDADGRPTSVSVLSPVHPALDAAAIEAVKSWRFEPARACGKPVAGGTFTLARRFELGD